MSATGRSAHANPGSSGGRAAAGSNDSLADVGIQ